MKMNRGGKYKGQICILNCEIRIVVNHVHVKKLKLTKEI